MVGANSPSKQHKHACALRMLLAASALVLTSALAWSFRDHVLAKFLKFVPLTDQAPRQIRPKKIALVYEDERPALINAPEFQAITLDTHRINFESICEVASNIVASTPCLIIIEHSRNALKLASVLSELSVIPTALYVRTELCSGERIRVADTKPTLDGVVPDAASCIDVFNEVVNRPRMPRALLLKLLQTCSAIRGHLDRKNTFRAGRLAYRLLWSAALYGDARVHDSASRLLADVSVARLAAFERVVAQCALRG